MAILTIFLHILAQNFSRWPKILNIVCLLTKTVTREQSQSIFIISELIPFFVRAFETLSIGPKIQNFVNMDNRSGTKCLKSLHKCERASFLRFWYPQNLSHVHPFFSVNVTILWSQDFKMLRKNRNKALLWEIYTQECLKPMNKQSGGNGKSFRDISGKVKYWSKSKTIKVP